VLHLLLGLSLRLEGDVFAQVLCPQAARRRLASPTVRMLRQLVRCVAVRQLAQVFEQTERRARARYPLASHGVRFVGAETDNSIWARRPEGMK
jgi:hypothetical protein